MTPFARQIAEFLWSQSWQIIFLFPLVWLACYGLRKASAHWRYLLWLALLIKCIIPAPVQIPVPPVWSKLSAPIKGTITSDQAPLPAKMAPAKAPPAPKLITGGPAGTQSWDWLRACNWIALLWAAGAGSFLASALVKGWIIQAKLKKGRAWPDMDLECEFLELIKNIGIRTRPKLCLIHNISQPFVWGALRGSIYLPAGFGESATAEHRKLVMAHELAHVLRWDAFLNFFQVLVQSIFFFHPLVWWLNARLRHEREKCCDETAIAALKIDSRAFGAAIIEQLAASFEPAVPPSSLAISGHARDLEDRIKSIMLPNRKFYRRPTLAAGAAIFLLACLIVSVGLPVLPDAATDLATGADGSFVAVELSSFCNADLNRRWLEGVADADLAQFDHGEMSGGVPFAVKGIVQLAGSGASQYPGSICGIRIGRAFTRLFLLHAANGQANEGVTVAALRLRYADGLTREIPLNYGEQLRDWQFREFEPVHSADTAMVWTGTTPGLAAQGMSLRLYRTTLANPRPSVAVAQIDYVSAQAGPAPFLAGITTQ